MKEMNKSYYRNEIIILYLVNFVIFQKSQMLSNTTEDLQIQNEIQNLKLQTVQDSNAKIQNEEGLKFQSNEQIDINSLALSPKKKIKKISRTQKITLRPSSLLAPYEHIIPQLIEKPQKSKRKATNIPKFIIKIFYKTLPVFPSPLHNERLREFSKQLESSITRFHLVELFGLNTESLTRDEENKINRQVLRRLLVRNYDNILSNTHIQHKRIYMLFSKKMLLRLNEPRLVGNIEI